METPSIVETKCESKHKIAYKTIDFFSNQYKSQSSFKQKTAQSSSMVDSHGISETIYFATLK